MCSVIFPSSLVKPRVRLLPYPLFRLRPVYRGANLSEHIPPPTPLPSVRFTGPLASPHFVCQ